MLRFTLLLFILSFSNIIHADLLASIAYQNGGDEVVDGIIDDEFTAGQGIELKLNYEFFSDRDYSLRTGFGSIYHQSKDQQKTESTFTYNLTFMVNRAPHHFGFGPTIQFFPPSWDDGDDSGSFFEEVFDIIFSSLGSGGIVYHYEYDYSEKVRIGVRYTDIEYNINPSSNFKVIDAGGLGVSVSVFF